MAGGNLFGRALSYVINELFVDALANSRTFQRFAVRTSKTLEDISARAAQAKKDLVEQVKDASDNFDSFKRQ